MRIKPGKTNATSKQNIYLRSEGCSELDRSAILEEGIRRLNGEWSNSLPFNCCVKVSANINTRSAW